MINLFLMRQLHVVSCTKIWVAFYEPQGILTAADVIPCVCFGRQMFLTVTTTTTPTPATTRWARTGLRCRTSPITMTAPSRWAELRSAFGQMMFLVEHLTDFTCLISVTHAEHKQPAFLQREKHGAGETRPVWGGEQRHSTCRLETPRTPQRLRSIHVTRLQNQTLIHPSFYLSFYYPSILLSNLSMLHTITYTITHNTFPLDKKKKEQCFFLIWSYKRRIRTSWKERCFFYSPFTGAFGIDRSYSYSASLGKYYNKGSLSPHFHPLIQVQRQSVSLLKWKNPITLDFTTLLVASL